MQVVNSFVDKQRRELILDRIGSALFKGEVAEGKYVAQLESWMTEYQGPSVQAVATNSCGTALLLMFEWLWRNGSKKVAMQNNTFYATGAAALEAGLYVSLVDSRTDCPCMCVKSLEQLLDKDPQIDVVCVTHIGGFIAKDYDAIVTLCQRKGIVLVEDCAHCFGLPSVGRFSQAACWSLYATKAVPAGEGGVLTTRDPKMAEYAQLRRQYSKVARDGMIAYVGPVCGNNFRMSELNAAVACVQLEYLQDILDARTRDAWALAQFVPCMLTGPSNWYKYPVLRYNAMNMRQTGKVYRQSDQLGHCLKGNRFGWKVDVLVDLSNSSEWASDHACLPIGEDLYRDKTVEEIKELLRV